MMRFFPRITPVFALVLVVAMVMIGVWPAASPVAAPVRVEAVEVELVARDTALVAGEPAWLGLRIRHDPHWHTYWRNPGDSGLPTRLDLSLPAGVEAGPLQWPAPERLFIPPLANYGYEGEIVLPFRLTPPPGATGRLRLSGEAAWLMCRDVCIPGEASLSIELPVIAAGAATQRSANAALFDQAFARMPKGPIEVSASIEGDRLSIGLPARIEAGGQTIATDRVQFFPYHENALIHAAAQVLFQRNPDESLPAAIRRLELMLSPEGRKLAGQDAALWVAAAQGVVVAEGRAFEVQPVAATDALVGGREISRIEGAPTKAAPAGPSANRLGLSPPAATSRLPGAGGLFDGAVRSSVPGGVPGAATSDSLFQSSGTALGFGLSLLFAALGGLILNLMPCVFPVVGLKVLSFAGSGHSPRRGAIAFSMGVLSSFWVLAALLIVLRAAGVAAGWGFQLQSPVFVAAMALLFVAIGLNFSGVFEFGVGMTRLARFDAPAGRAAAPSLWSTFGSGCLAVLVATPCTAPFMGSALGFTLSATLFETLAVFTALGLGMSLPYLLLGWFPGWLRWMPRPGRWMESLKQFLAFPMFATVAWLAWVLGQQAGIDAVLSLSLGAILLGLAAWIYGRFVQPAGRVPAIPAVLALGALLAALWTSWPSDQQATAGGSTVGAVPPAQQGATDPAAWSPWSNAQVNELLAAGRPVFVDFTAAWCVTCQVNKKAVLDRPPVVQAMQAAGVARLRADWTRRDAAITAELARWGRSGVPLYLFFPGPGRAPLILPELLTDDIVLGALHQVGSKRP